MLRPGVSSKSLEIQGGERGVRFLVEPWEKASTRASLKFMRVPGLFALAGTLIFAGFGCNRDLEGFSSGNASSGFGLRTQAAAKGSALSSFELTADGANEGDLLFYVVLTTGGGTVVTPAGLTVVDAIENKCIPAVIRIYSRAATEAHVAQKFEIEAPAAEVEATLLVISGVDPSVRAHVSKGIQIADTTFQADPITVATNDAPGHLLFTVLYAGSTSPTGAALLTSNGAAAFSTLAAPAAGSITPPSMTVKDSCGTVITTVLKDR